jgi:hypothetical protein
VVNIGRWAIEHGSFSEVVETKQKKLIIPFKILQVDSFKGLF